MKVFISWSGHISGKVAGILRRYLPCMIQGLDVFMSEHDLESGARWSLQLAEKLEDANFGILCLTSDNLESPWLLFEAGSLAKHVKGHACGLLLGSLTSSNVTGPLAQFQHRSFNEGEFRKLVADINGLLDVPLEDSRLNTVFRQWWSTINEECQKILTSSPTSATPRPKREESDVLDEMLRRIRNVERAVTPTESSRRSGQHPRTDHFYTASEEEAMSMDGYVPEGSAFYAYPSEKAGTVPLLRLVSPQTGDHFYTISERERDVAIHTYGYRLETIACYVHASQEPGTTPLFRLWNYMRKDHFYTISTAQVDHAITREGYRNEGTEGYVYAEPAEGTVLILRFLKVG